MKVPGSNSSNISALRSSTPVSPASGGVRATGSTGRDDKVQISALSSQINALGAQPASHASKLVELSSAVSAGRYQVDAEAVSAKIIQEHMRPAA